MTDPIQAAANRRRLFQFRLRTLLAVVTVAAVSSWGYWVGWPSWQAFQMRKKFESNVRSFKVGDNLSGATSLAGTTYDALIVLQQAQAGLPVFRSISSSRPVHTRFGLPVRSITQGDLYQSTSTHVVTSLRRSGCFRPSDRLAGRDSHPLEISDFHGVLSFRHSQRLPTNVRVDDPCAAAGQNG